MPRSLSRLSFVTFALFAASIILCLGLIVFPELTIALLRVHPRVLGAMLVPHALIGGFAMAKFGILAMAVAPASAGSGATDWFSTFVADLATAAEAAWAAVEPELKKVETAVATYAPEVIGKMAQLAANAVTAQWGLTIPGEEKFGKAVTTWIQSVEAQLGFTPSVPDAHAAVQGAYHKVAALAAASKG